ncbi:MAG: SNF2-related protein, partial [Opitutales bacterium]
MRLVKNIGNDRVIDLLRTSEGKSLAEVVANQVSIFGLQALRENVSTAGKFRLLLAKASSGLAELWGGESERSFRNELRAQHLSRHIFEWLSASADLQISSSQLPQSLITMAAPGDGTAILGNCPPTAEGLGLAPGNRFGLIQASESPEELAMFREWFNGAWRSVEPCPAAAEAILERHQFLAEEKAPSLLYYIILHRLFRDRGEELDEDQIVKSATGIKNAVVWRKLYRFQRDGVVGAIDKLERFGGAIIADSVGLGKTFEALAVIKYYELRNDRVLVLCPKRLRENWTLYASNDTRNSLAADRFNYDVLNHTDLSREQGMSGDMDLAYVNWGNYDLVVIDESHNFRNKSAHRDHLSRYERLMQQIIRDGVKTRVLMLSATPVNNRLADLKNQIAFITEGDDEALEGEGIPSINATLQRAQKQFNAWQKLGENERTSESLLESLSFDYFKLLDLLTIARSRKHVMRYYGTSETGDFPERLPPLNVKAEVDLAGKFPTIRQINDEIRRLHLAAYAPLRYVLPHKREYYDRHYSQQLKGGKRIFRQVDREESLVALMRVNLLKRMESSVVSFALTVERQLKDVERLLAKLDAHEDAIEETTIEEVDTDDPGVESLLVGRKVKVLLQDIDKLKWRQELQEDRNRLATLHSASAAITPERDAKLADLREMIERKTREPIKEGNRKVLVFTAFADTAESLYRELAPH